MKAGLRRAMEKLMLAKDKCRRARPLDLSDDKQKELKILFVEAKWFGKGVRQFLIHHAIDNCGATAV